MPRPSFVPEGTAGIQQPGIGRCQIAGARVRHLRGNHGEAANRLAVSGTGSSQHGTQRYPVQVYPGGQCAPRPPQAAGTTGPAVLAAALSCAPPATTIASARQAMTPAHRMAAVAPRMTASLRIGRSPFPPTIDRHRPIGRYGSRCSPYCSTIEWFRCITGATSPTDARQARADRDRLRAGREWHSPVTATPSSDSCPSRTSSDRRTRTRTPPA